MPEELFETDVQPASTNEDLRATINAAIEKQRGGAEPAPDVEAAPAAEGTEAGTPPTDDRARDAAGRFAEKAKDAAPAKEAAKAAGDPTEATPEPPEATQHKPPVGWSAAAKAKFPTLPPEVQADIAKREVEIDKGFAKLADYKGIDRFVEQARQSNTTLEAALTSYTNIENLLRKDPVRGILEVCRNVGIDPRQLPQMLAGGQAPPQPGTPPAPQIHPALLQELAGVKQTVASLQQERQQAAKASLEKQIDTFFSDPQHKHADTVSGIMEGLIKQAVQTGTPIDLGAIYQSAIWQHPEVREELIKERAAALVPPPPNPIAKAAAVATQAKQLAKATVGAPARSTPAGSPPPQNQSLRDTILSAVEAARGV